MIAGSEGSSATRRSIVTSPSISTSIFSVARPMSISTWGLCDRYTWMKQYYRPHRRQAAAPAAARRQFEPQEDVVDGQAVSVLSMLALRARHMQRTTRRTWPLRYRRGRPGEPVRSLEILRHLRVQVFADQPRNRTIGVDQDQGVCRATPGTARSARQTERNPRRRGNTPAARRR